MTEVWLSKLKNYFDRQAIDPNMGDDDLALNGYKAPRVISYWTEPVRERFLNDIVSKLMLSKDLHVLDVGCGTGMILRKIGVHVAHITGIDFSAGMLAIARHRLPHNAILQQADAATLPFKNEVFDRVVCYHVITNFLNDDFTREVLTQLVRVTRKGGFVFVGNTPDYDKKDEQAKLIRNRSQGKLQLSLRTPLLQSLETRFRNIWRGRMWSHSVQSSLSNRFYRKDFFRQFAEQTSCDIEILPLEVEGYLYAPCRFDVRLWPT
jgi:ubiquinone/menaquinone biosynthesis C-methylase UbiE